MERHISKSDKVKIGVMQSLGDLVLINGLCHEGDIHKVTSCWLALSDMVDDNGDSYFPIVSEVVQSALFSLAHHLGDQIYEEWDEIVDRASRNCSALQPECPRVDISDAVLGISRSHIFNLISDESVELYFNGCNNLLGKSSQGQTAVDRDAYKSFVAAYISLFGSMIVEISEEEYEVISEFLYELALDQYSVVTFPDGTDFVEL